jgi:phage terminase large subunit
MIKKFHKFMESAAREGKRYVISYGGARSGKSVSVAQKVVRDSYENQDEGIDTLVVQKTRPALRDGAWDQIHQVLDSWQLEYSERESTLDIHIGKSRIAFRGMDNPEKLKSTQFNYIWMEEATSCDWEDFLQLKLRLSKPGPVPQQMFLTFNPIDATHWVWERLVKSGDPEIAILHSTYLDNPYLSKEYKKSMEDLINQDIRHYEIYALGKPGKIENIIYNKWDVLDLTQIPLNVQNRIKNPDSYGLDLGYAHPTALLSYWEYEGEDYIQEIIYNNRLTTEDLLTRMKEEKVNVNVEIFSPPEQPGVISHLCAKGYNAKAVPPECRVVKDGLDYCKGRKLHIIRGSDNIIKEIKAYSYKMRKDASGESVSTDEPVKFMDDAMDAMRYSRASMRMQYQASVKSSVSKGDPLMDILDARNIETRRDSRLGFYAG